MLICSKNVRMTLSNEQECFVLKSSDKVCSILKEIMIDENVHNGKRKVESMNKVFMDR